MSRRRQNKVKLLCGCHMTKCAGLETEAFVTAIKDQVINSLKTEIHLEQEFSDFLLVYHKIKFNNFSAPPMWFCV